MANMWVSSMDQAGNGAPAAAAASDHLIRSAAANIPSEEVRADLFTHFGRHPNDTVQTKQPCNTPFEEDMEAWSHHSDMIMGVVRELKMVASYRGLVSPSAILDSDESLVVFKGPRNDTRKYQKKKKRPKTNCKDKGRSSERRSPEEEFEGSHAPGFRVEDILGRRERFSMFGSP